jgi:hypothetical protein
VDGLAPCESWPGKASTVGSLFPSLTITMPPIVELRITRFSRSIAANRDTFDKLRWYSIVLFVVSLGTFFALRHPAVSSELRTVESGPSSDLSETSAAPGEGCQTALRTHSPTALSSPSAGLYTEDRNTRDIVS